MLSYIYDGTLEGFFTAVFESFERKVTPEQIISVHKQNPALFMEPIEILTDEVKATRVYEGILNRVSKLCFKNTLLSFYSEQENIEVEILKYLQIAFKQKASVDYDLSNSIILNINQLRQKVSREIHQFQGFVRFRKLEGELYFAPIQPDFNIARFLAPHFAKRYPVMDWMILDMKRKTGVFYQAAEKNWRVIESGELELLADFQAEGRKFFSEDEKVFQDLWKNYFRNIAIQERKNPKLQRQFLQKKYWKYLIEKEES